MSSVVTVVTAASGDATLKVDGRFLHSRRDPRTEARRFLTSQLQGQHPRIVLIVGAGLGYLTAAAREVCPGCSVLAVHLAEDTRRRAVAQADETWSPSAMEPVSRFLARSIDEEDFPALVTVFWKPAFDAYPETADAVGSAVRSVTSRLNASLSTSGYFGPRWFRNAVVNYLKANRWLTPTSTTLPIVVAAPGPTLAGLLEALREGRGLILLMAVASAAKPLVKAGLTPDLIVHQDAGFFTREHLRGITPDIPRVQPLSAKPTTPYPCRVAWLRYDHPLDALLWDEATEKAVAMPQMGTVTATAVRLALAMTRNSVYLAGVDMASRDLQSHVKGHPFESYFHSRSLRTEPYLQMALSRTIHATRVGDADSEADIRWRASADLHIYADWFRGLHAEDRLYRLSPSPVDLGLRHISADVLSVPSGEPAVGTSSSAPFRATPAPPSDERRRRLEQLLRKWRHMAESDLKLTQAPLRELPQGLRSVCRQLALAEYLHVDRLERTGKPSAADQASDNSAMDTESPTHERLGEAYRRLHSRIDATLKHFLERLEDSCGAETIRVQEDDS